MAVVAGAVAIAALPLANAGSTSAATAPTPAAPGANPADCPGGTLASHAPIAINTDADWTAANGVTGGSGTPTDPYVISCWSIQGSNSSTTSAGIGIAQAAGDKAFTIRDVRLTGANASANSGISFSATSTATVTQSTISTYSAAIRYGAQTVNLTNNLLTGNTDGADGTTATQTLNVTGNYVTGSAKSCLNLGPAGHGLVTNNTCINNPGAGFLVSGVDPSTFIVSGNTAKGNSPYGFSGGGGATLRGNSSEGNDYGVILTGPNVVVDGNTVEGNRSGGVDITGGSYSTISNNVISNNGGPGITADPADAQGELGSDDTIVGNHIGGNPYGIVFFGPQPANLVQQTDWTDGAQSITDFADQNTVVDAGSAKRAGAAQPVLFSDYVARMTAGPGTAPPTVPAVGLPATPPNPTVGVITGISWNFGDGSAPVSVSDPSQGHGPAPQVSHTYANAGTYTATLTVAGNAGGKSVTLSDTVPVTITSGTPVPQADCGAGHGPNATATSTAWPTLGNSPARSFCTPQAGITAANVSQLVPKWRFPTAGSVTATPAVATVPVGGKATQVAYDGDFDGMFYAINSNTGLPVWSACLVDHPPAPAPVCDPPYPTNPKNQVDYGAIVASPAVANVGASPRVFEAATDHMWSLDAATGKVAWSFDTAGDSGVPNYEIEASPLVVPSPSTGEQLVVFSVDCNGFCDKPGGVYAVDAGDGHLVWFFDPVSGQNYQPAATNITSFAPTDVGPKSAGDGACGGIWTSQTADLKLGLLYTSTADCPQEPMSSPYYEAAFALDLGTGAPAWHYQPRVLDVDDMDFGATPNVYAINTGHGPHDVVGFASKDGTYRLFDAAKGTVLWEDKLVAGGNFGGFYNSATDGARIYLTGALGTLSGTTVSPADDAKKGRVWAIDAATGAVDWVQNVGAPTLGQDSVIPGVYFDTGLDHAVHAYATDTGTPLAVLPTGGAVSSGVAVVGNSLFTGAGTGATWRSAVGTCLDPANPFGECDNPPTNSVLAAPVPIPVGEYGQGIWDFCLASDPTCQTSRVNM